MPQSLRVVFGLCIVTLLVGGPLWYRSQHSRTYRNFRVVENGVLYRCGQLNVAGLKRLIHDYGIKTIVSLRDGEKATDMEEEAFITKKTDLNFVRIQPRKWWSDTGPVPAEEGLAEFRAVLDNKANYPVLIHCLAGVHRTGAFCAVARMDYWGWSNADAIQEMKNMGYSIFDQHQDIKKFLEEYRPKPRSAQQPMFRVVGRAKALGIGH